MKLKHKIFCIIMSLCIMAAYLPMVMAADSEVPQGLWTDYAADSFAGGTGTEDDPYQIASAKQLALLAKDVNSGVVGKTHNREYFVLTDDIDLSAHVWTPLGYESYASGSAQSFSGYFDGGNHKVTGLYVDERGKNRSAGLFGCVTATDNKPIIQNLTVENGTVYAGDSNDDTDVQYGAGLLIGSITIAGGSSVEYAVIKNCTVSGMVSSNMYAGGLVGSANYTHFENCSADVKVNGYCVTGGFIGYAFKSVLTDCTAYGNVKSQGWSTGGFTGIMFYDTTVTHCAAYGDVEANDWNLGGFAGYVEENSSIKNSIAMGNVKSNVTGWEPKVGGFAGTLVTASSIEKCHAAGKITANKDDDTVAGMIGYTVDTKNSVKSSSFDSEKNAALSAVGGDSSGTGTYDVTKATTAKVLSNICEDYYGGHDLEDVAVVAPTCTEDGHEAGKKCTRCEYKEGLGVIKTSGHDYKNGVCQKCGATCAHTGGTATCADKATCGICGADYGDLDSSNHTNLKRIPAKAATQSADGNIEYWYCDGCDKYFSDAKATKEITKSDTVIKKGTSNSPQTGDTNNVSLFMSLLLTGGCALIGTAVCVNKKKDYNTK